MAAETRPGLNIAASKRPTSEDPLCHEDSDDRTRLGNRPEKKKPESDYSFLYGRSWEEVPSHSEQ